MKTIQRKKTLRTALALSKWSLKRLKMERTWHETDTDTRHLIPQSSKHEKPSGLQKKVFRKSRSTKRRDSFQKDL